MKRHIKYILTQASTDYLTSRLIINSGIFFWKNQELTADCFYFVFTDTDPAVKTTVNNNPSDRSDCVNGKTSHGGSGGVTSGGGGVGTADHVNEDDDRFDEEQCNSLNSLTNNGTIYFAF